MTDRLEQAAAAEITLLLGGDVMLGRGVDQILPHPLPPAIHEEAMRSAIGYVDLAERASGPIARPVPFGHVWGDALEPLREPGVDLRIVNLETAVSRSERWEPKGINYRMSPENVPCLGEARIDCCSLANNHVLDWGREGLIETLRSLIAAGIGVAGAGREIGEAETPALLPLEGRGRVLVHAVACSSSGVPPAWSAGAGRPGVHLIDEPSEGSARRLAARIAPSRHPGDIVVLSIHWGGNWGYEVSPDERDFAQTLVACGAVDVIHGHSSHHFRGIELFRDRPILYGCGDLINDYEGIGGYEDYCPELVLLYRLRLVAGEGSLRALDLLPYRLRGMRLNRADRPDAEWIWRRLDRECRRLGGRVLLGEDGTLSLAT